jgi:hypothetical protein
MSEFQVLKEQRNPWELEPILWWLSYLPLCNKLPQLLMSLDGVVVIILTSHCTVGQ